MKDSLPSLLKSKPQREVRKHSRILAPITVLPASFLSLFSLAFFYLNKYQITHVHLSLTAISDLLCTLGRIKAENTLYSEFLKKELTIDY